MVSDLWPEAAIQLGVLRQPQLIALAEWLERSTYRHADLVWVVTEQLYQALLQRGVPAPKLLLLTNGVDTETFVPQEQTAARESLGWAPNFTVLYVGTHGRSHGLQTVLATAQFLQDQQPYIRIVLVGDGEEKPALEAEAQRRQLQNVTFLDPIPHEHVPQLLAAADVCLAHTRSLPLFAGVLPIKMLEALSCARPLILAVNGEACQLVVEEARAALHVEPENAQALAEAILRLYEQPALAQELGANGRSYIEKHFAYEQLITRLETRLAQLLA
jgi:glycosyltransferase involved in cell wall biosynthesis